MMIYNLYVCGHGKRREVLSYEVEIHGHMGRCMLGPLVSVIMPAYNAERYIRGAIDSVLDQTYEDWELIVVEDGSTDATLDVIRGYTDKRIRLFRNDRNRGIAFSTNRGIEESRGKYIALLDDDDIAEKDRIKLQVEYLEQHIEIDILGGRSVYIDERDMIIDHAPIPRKNPKYIKSVLLFNCMDFMNSTAMIRKEFIEKNHLYYHDGCYGMQDFRFYIESSKVGNISTIGDFLLRHRIYTGNTTHRNMTVFKEERAIVYAQLQRYSLWKSGFRLSEGSLRLLNKVLAETDGRCRSVQEFQELFIVFKELLQQGRKMGIDHQNELSHVCRVKLAEQIINLNDLL